MKRHADDFRVREGHKVDLSDWPTKIAPLCDSKDQYKDELSAQVQELRACRSCCMRRTTMRCC